MIPPIVLIGLLQASICRTGELPVGFRWMDFSRCLVGAANQSEVLTAHLDGAGFIG